MKNINIYAFADEANPLLIIKKDGMFAGKVGKS